MSLTNNTIEKFTPGGAGSLFASTGLNFPADLAFEASGNLYAWLSNNTIEKYTSGGEGSIFATNAVFSGDIAIPLSSVPEPSSLALGCLALVSLGLFACARHRLRDRAA